VVCVTACLYPGLSRIAWRFRDVLDHDDAWAGLAEAVTRRLRAICSEDLPDFVAATLLRDAGHGLRRGVRRERAWRDHVKLHEVSAAPEITVQVREPRSDPFGEGSGLTQLDAALIRATRVNGLNLTDAARLLGLSYEAAKKRRQRAEAVWLVKIGLATGCGARRGPNVRHVAA
jgi:hypothetical protein